MSRVYAVVPAAGSGSRMGQIEAPTKLFLEISENTTVLELCLRSLLAANVCDGIVVAVRESELEMAKRIASVLAGGDGAPPLHVPSNLQSHCEGGGGTPPLHAPSSLPSHCRGGALSPPEKLQSQDNLEIEVIVGGETRQESVFKCLNALKGKADFVLIHDGARPFCETELITKVTKEALKKKAAILAVPSTSTLKRVNDKKIIQKTIQRDDIWEAQTPQVFDFKLIYDAHINAVMEGYLATDDSELVERMGTEVTIVEGSSKNVKITRSEDLEF